MRKSLLLFSLLVVLAAPAMAAPRNDGPSDRQSVFARLVRAIKAFEDIVVSWPKP
jgi:hypothetical protein